MVRSSIGLGTPTPDNDLWIAALVLENDLALITRDGHFALIYRPGRPVQPFASAATSHNSG